MLVAQFRCLMVIETQGLRTSFQRRVSDEADRQAGVVLNNKSSEAPYLCPEGWTLCMDVSDKCHYFSTVQDPVKLSGTQPLVQNDQILSITLIHRCVMEGSSELLCGWRWSVSSTIVSCLFQLLVFSVLFQLELSLLSGENLKNKLYTVI